MNASMLRCDNDPVGMMSAEKKKGRIRVLFCQLNNMSTKAVRDVKVKGLKHLERVYDTDIHMYNEHGVNCDNGTRNTNFNSWMGDAGRSRCVMAYNKHDKEYEGVHQPGGTAVRVTGAMTQYVRKTNEDFRGLGRYCSVVMWANPNKKCRFVSVYNICKGKPKGLRTQYQQIMRQMQREGINGVAPRDLFNKDFVKQCANWIREGEELCVMGDVNGDVVNGIFTLLLAEEGVEMEEFGEDFCVGEKVDSYVFGSGRISGGWKTSNLELTQLIMLPFKESVGDHRSWIVEFSTRSVLGTNLVKIQRAVGRRLVSTNAKATRSYNNMVESLFESHRIVPRIKNLLQKVDHCGYPGPPWLEKKIVKLHVEMDELRMRASEKCRKILTPVAPCGPVIRHWDKMIHLYKALLKILTDPERHWNHLNTYRVANKKGIENPLLLSVDEVLDGLRYCRIQMDKARKSAAPAREEMLRLSIASAAEKGDMKKVKEIKQIMNGEKSKRNWCIVNATVDDPRAPSVLEIGREENGRMVWYKDQEGVNKTIQDLCVDRYSLARKSTSYEDRVGLFE